MAQFPSLAAVIFGAAFTVGVSVSCGMLLMRRLRVTLYRGETALFAFLAGSACLSLTTFFLSLIHQARAAVFLSGGTVVIACAVWARGREPRPKSLPALPRTWFSLFIVVFAAFFLVYFFNALAPEVSPDGSGYHLGNVARYWRESGFAWRHHSIYAHLSQGLEMLFLVAFAFGRHSAAALVHCAFQAALPLLIVCYGRRFGFPAPAACAAILVYASPVAGIDGSSAYNDVAVATLLFAGFYLLQVWNELHHDNILILIGLLVGFAGAVKYSAGLVLPFAVGFVWFRASPDKVRARLQALLPLLLASAILIVPWLLRNWLWLGNPAAPFLNLWFPNPYFQPAEERQYLADLGHYPHVNHYWKIPLQVTVLGGLVPGMIGPVFLLAPFALLALRHPHGRRLLLAAAVFAVPAYWNTDTRFLIPALPPLALAMGLGMANSWGVMPALALFQAVVCLPGVLSLYCAPYAWRITSIPVRAALRREPEAVFLARRLPGFALKSAIERNVAPGQQVFSFAGRPEAYLDRDIMVGYESSLGSRLETALRSAAAQSARRAAASELKASGIAFLLVDDADPAARDMKQYSNLWGITELAEAHGTRFYRID
ncbi:MAG: hypothetical protein LAP87_25665 [Acidobacteriia bacterium]|nr:hypothetical protein [Terriglobia bacterium]